MPIHPRNCRYTYILQNESDIKKYGKLPAAENTLKNKVKSQ